MTESVWGPVHQDMTALLADHPDDVPAVVDQLTKLQDILERRAAAARQQPARRLQQALPDASPRAFWSGCTRAASPTRPSCPGSTSSSRPATSTPCGCGATASAGLPAGVGGAVLPDRRPGLPAAAVGGRRGERAHQLRPAVRAGDHVRPPGLRPGRRRRPAPRLPADQRDLRGGDPRTCGAATWTGGSC